jgi:predicted RNA-binding Zn ribbon-like protein
LVVRRDDIAPQPGGREPAPGGLALVQAFLNTHYDLTAEHGGEVLVHPDALAAWLAGHELLAREALRALALANHGGNPDPAAYETLDRAAAGAFTGVRIEPGGASFATASPSSLDAALGPLLARTAAAMLDGSWPRLKACPGRGCGWAFYDHSRNQSARWCAMKVCGDREKARTYYRRRAAAR